MADNRIDVQRIISLISAMRPTMDTTAIADAVTTWLGNHPEATTTVQDGAITEAKLATALATKIGTITTLSSTVTQQSEDIANLQTEIVTKADAIEETATGEIVTITDGSDGLPVSDLVVALEPVQDLNGYDNPWPAGGGTNLLGFNDVSAIASGTNKTLTITDELIRLDVSATVAASSLITSTAFATATRVTSLAAGTYIFSVSDFATSLSTTTATGITLNLGDGTSVANGNSFTLTEETDIESITWYTIYYSAGDYVQFRLQIEEGTTATTFAPYSNICPITGHTDVTVTRTGVNVWDEQWELGVIDSGGNLVDSSDYFRTKNLIRVKPSASYCLHYGSFSSELTLLYVYQYDSVENFISSFMMTAENYVFTTDAECSFIRFRSGGAQKETSYANNISLNSDSTDTSYHAYSGQTKTVNWQTEAGTVYGGTLDLTTGVLTVDRAKFAIGDRAWTYNTNASSSLSPYFYTSVSDVKYEGIPNNNVYNILSDTYKTVKRQVGYFNDFCICADGTTTAISQIQIKDSRYTSVSEFTSAMGTSNVVYYLTTPLTYTLTAQQMTTLLGDNNFWHDANGNTTVKYKADTKLYIDAKFAELSALIASL